MGRRRLIDPDDLLDADEAAAHLGLTSSDAFHTYARRFPALTPKISKGRYIRLWLRQDLDRFIADNPSLFKRRREDTP